MASISQTQTKIAVRPSGRAMTQKTREALYGYLMASPWLLGFLLFTLYPLIASFVIGLYSTNFLNRWEWVGMHWFRAALVDVLVRKALLNTAYFSFVSVPLSSILALMIAVMLNQGIRFQSFWRTVYYLPSVVS